MKTGKMVKPASDAEQGLRQEGSAGGDVAWLAVAYISLCVVLLLGVGAV